jgi:hypothetical protein
MSRGRGEKTRGAIGMATESVDHTIAFDDGLTMRFPQCIKCGAPIVWLDVIETEAGPRCVGLCRACLASLRRHGGRGTPPTEA